MPTALSAGKAGTGNTSVVVPQDGPLVLIYERAVHSGYGGDSFSNFSSTLNLATMLEPALHIQLADTTLIDSVYPRVRRGYSNRCCEARYSYPYQRYCRRYNYAVHHNGSASNRFELGAVGAGEAIQIAYQAPDGKWLPLSFEEEGEGTSWSAVGSARVDTTYGRGCGVTWPLHEMRVRLAYAQPEADNFEVTFDKALLSHGDLTAIYVQALDADGAPVDLADGTPLTLRMEGGEWLGGLRYSISGPSKSSISFTYGEIKAGQGASKAVFATGDGENPAGWARTDRTVSVTAELEGDPQRQGGGDLVVVGDYQIETEVAPADTLRYKATAVVRVQALDLNNVPLLNFSDGELFDFELTASSKPFGTLKWGGQEGDRVTGVPYSDAKAWKVQFVADGDKPSSVAGVQIRVRAAESYKIEATSGLIIRGGFWNITPFAQGDSTWGGDTYDHTDATIASKGCAMTTQAMILKATGSDVDPGHMNKWMVEQGAAGFDDRGNVWWQVIDKYPGNNSVHYYEAYGYGDLEKKADRPTLDRLLKQGYLVVAGVKGAGHWVIVTEKRGDTYGIYDPAGGVETTLEERYDNSFVRLRAFELGSF